MAFYREKKERDFTIMSNHHLKSKELSLKAKGLMSQILSLPDDWNFSISGLAALNRETRDCIRSAVRELELQGYLERVPNSRVKSRFSGVNYNIFEKPRIKPADTEDTSLLPLSLPKIPPAKTSSTVRSPAILSSAEESAQYSTDRSSTYRSSTYGSNTKEEKHAPSCEAMGVNANVLLTPQELAKLKTRFPLDLEDRIDDLSSYLAHTGKGYQSHYRALLNWAERDRCSGAADYSYEEGTSY